LSSSGRRRGVLAEAEDFAHFSEALDQVVRRLGGLTRRWRSARMATVCHPGSGTLTAEFAGLAKYYGLAVDVCPPRHGNRKGVVEKASHSAAQRWWRTLPDDTAWPAAQQGVDTLAARMDGRPPCGSSTTPPTCCWSARPASATPRLPNGIRELRASAGTESKTHRGAAARRSRRTPILCAGDQEE